VVLVIGSWLEDKDGVFWSGTLLERSVGLGFEGAGSELVWKGEPIVIRACVGCALVKLAAGTVIVECADGLDIIDVESDIVERAPFGPKKQMNNMFWLLIGKICSKQEKIEK
jgi:hypothetical protein